MTHPGAAGPLPDTVGLADYSIVGVLSDELSARRLQGTPG